MSEEVHDAQIVPVEQTRAIAPIHRPVLTKQAIQAETEQRKLLGEFISANMVEGIDGDYGVIPGTSKRTLLKPGAEKLVQLFYCTAKYTVIKQIENYDTGLFSYSFKCEIINQAGYTVAEGVGFCSTYESKYRWSSMSRKCPHCGKETIIKGKEEYGGGWLCFAKKGGCGAKFADSDKTITSQEIGQEQNPDIVDKVNTVFKIAKKRALVDAAIALARCSDMFTQDMEDVEANAASTPAQSEAQYSKDLQKDVQQGQARHAEQQKAKAETNAEAVMNSGQKQEAPQQQQGQYVNYECPKCGVKAVGRSKYPPRNKPDLPKDQYQYHCYEKSGGCKANFNFDDVDIVKQSGQNAPQQQKPPAENDDSLEVIDGWRNWAQMIGPDLAKFNTGYQQSIDDLKALDRKVQIKVWGAIVQIANSNGWIFDRTASAFVKK